MRDLIKLDAGEQMMSGIAPGLNAEAVLLWADGENVEFKEGGVAKQAGYKVLKDVGEDINALAQQLVNGDKRVYVGTASKLMLWDGSSLSTLGSGYSGGSWDLLTYGSWLLATNGADRPQIWQNSGSASNLSTPFSTAKILTKKGPHIIALNTSNRGANAYEWCSADDPTDWVSSDSNSAGSSIIRDLESEIQAAVPLGDGIGVYGKDSLHLLSYLGPPLYFGHKKVQTGIGASSRRAPVAVGRRNFVLHRRGAFVTDGVSFNYIDDPAMTQWLKDNVDWEQESTIAGWHNETENKVTWSVPTTSGRKEIHFNYMRNVWCGRGTFGFTTGLEEQVLQGPLAAKGSELLQLNYGNNAGGAAFSAWVQTKPLDAGQDDLFKTWQQLRLHFRGSPQVRVGVMDNLGQAVEWLDSAADAKYLQYFSRDSVYIVLQFRSDLSDVSWLVNGFEIAGAAGGMIA